MKKFLRLQLPHEWKDIPAEVDAVILAAAAMRAKKRGRRLKAIKLIVPGITAAAAAAAVICVFPSGNMPSVPVVPRQLNEVAVVSSLPQSGSPIQQVHAPVSQTLSTNEILSLSDMTVLEQENYNLSYFAEISLDSDNFTI
ncbi:MAG: hypothetical protein E7057_10695 [Lentisphaerae bacterium]|nr:hypothetical protein [Lentisphaerota bacterium]